MPAAGRLPFPVEPDLPESFAPSAPTLGSGDVWENVRGDGKVEVGEWVADAQLHESIWTGAQLVGRRFSGLVCQDVRFERCDLAGAVLEGAAFTRVQFESCRINGAILAGATLNEVAFLDCVIGLADFRMAHVQRSAFNISQLRDADFYGCDLTDVRFSGCDLGGANFDTAKAHGVDLRGSTVEALRGVVSLASAHIGAEQILPLGAALVGSLGFVID